MAGLCRPSNTAILHLPTSKGGFNLPRLHKKLQVSRQCQLLMSCDSCVRFLADHNLRRELGVRRKKFRPATLARVTNPAAKQSKAAKKLVKEDDDNSLLETLQSLDQQGQMSRCTDSKCAAVWSRVVQHPQEFGWLQLEECTCTHFSLL